MFCLRFDSLLLTINLVSKISDPCNLTKTTKAGYRSLGSVLLCESSASLVWCWFSIEGVTAAVKPANDPSCPLVQQECFFAASHFWYRRRARPHLKYLRTYSPCFASTLRHVFLGIYPRKDFFILEPTAHSSGLRVFVAAHPPTFLHTVEAINSPSVRPRRRLLRVGLTGARRRRRAA